MSYDTFKSKLGYGARPSIFEIVLSVPDAVALKVGKAVKDITDDLKFYVSGTQIPGRTIGEVTVNYQGEEVKLAGDATYDNLTYTFLDDVEMFVRDVIEIWSEIIVDPITNARAVPDGYKEIGFIYAVSNEVDDATGLKKRIKGWKLDGAYPTNFVAIDKSWDTKDAIETSTFTLRYDKHIRVDASGSVSL